MADQMKTGPVLALWQAETVAGDTARAFDQISRGARAAAGAGADVIVFPELFLTGYEREDLADLALGRDDFAARLGEIAAGAGVAICAGYPERLADGLANAALCVSATGEVLANHRKIQLYGEIEPRRFHPGTRYCQFELAGRQTSILICYDVEFAPHVAALAAKGVEVILVPTAAMHPFAHIGQHVVPAMAANHGVAIVYANLCGSEAHLQFFGGSVIVDADGQVAARAGARPGMLLARLPAAHAEGIRSTQGCDYRPVTV
ncbi:MAG: nitrilase-related carbon-nitrogen hydrolase [Paracoccaceae bacterium]